MNYRTFLAYLIKNYEDKYFFDLLDTLDECNSELDDLRPEDFENDENYSDEREYYTMRSLETEKEIRDMFSEYCNCCGNAESYEKELKIISEYRENLKKALFEKTKKQKK